MNNTIGLNIPLTTSYNGKGIKAASKDLTGLEGLANKVTKNFLGFFATEKLIEFGKKSVDAFASEAKQAAIFGQTITSLGFAMQQSGITEYITKISEETGILKDQLEPAFASLLRYTRNVSESKKLFGTALNVSAGTGKSLLEVSNALGRASQGNYTALVRLGAGITTANAKTLTFQQNLNVLNSSFQGDAAAAANSFAGTIDRLKNSVHEAMVQIGSGLTAAFASLANSANGFHWIDTIGQKIHDLIYQIAKFAITTKDILGGLNPFNTKNWTGKNDVSGKIKSDIAKLDANFAKAKAQISGTDSAQYKVNNALLAQAQKDLATQKQITAQKQAQLAAEKAKAVLTAAAKVLDVQQAEITAAMMNASLSQDELTRLKLKNALLNDNSVAAGQLAQQLIATQLASLQVQASDPFGNMNKSILDAIFNLKDLQSQLVKLGAPSQINFGFMQSAAASAAALGLPTEALTNPNWQPPVDTSYLYEQSLAASAAALGLSTADLANAQGNVTVNLMISDQTSGGATVTQSSSLNGTPTTVTRINSLGFGTGY